ncbi:MAG: hypothetical protein KF685_06505 [Acidobacteria bacterium]|nr:hypothetical protein [Acidobacteriota bacterium]
MKGSPIFTDLSLAAKTDRLANSIFQKATHLPKTPLLTKEGWTAFRRTGWFFPQFSLRLCVIFLFLSAAAFAQVPAPKDVIGFTPGDDRKLASWAQTVDYFKKLAETSDRVQFHEIGKSTMGRPFVYVVISSPENIKSLEKYKNINDELADPRKIQGGNPTGREGVSKQDAAAKRLVSQGKTIVLKTFGVHSTEVGSYLSSMLIAHELASSNEPRIKKILDETITLIVPALSPDGVDIVKDWYDKTLGTPYEGTSPPELYHKYVGHDLNRDWYAFTQVESQLTVEHIHNVWHPQIVHDVHQQGTNGARFFIPPYMDPVEPNVPKQIVEGYTELGLYVAKDMRGKGFQGLTTGTTYDAWTPARAYSHYHGGVRILSETASARLATPITVKAEDLRGGRGVNPHKDDANNGPAWKGGEWKLRDITNYMTTAAFSILDHAAANREKWLRRFHEIGKEAIRPRTNRGELYGFRIKIDDNFPRLLNILERAGVQYEYPSGGKETTIRRVNYFDSTIKYPTDSIVIPLEQPYGLFAKALLERQPYPDLKDENGNPIPPYDVTAHTIPLFMNLKAEEIHAPYKQLWRRKVNIHQLVSDCHLGLNKTGIFKSYVSSMDEGWTRWMFDNGPCTENEPVSPEEIRNNIFRQKKQPTAVLKPAGKQEHIYKTIIFPDQSPNQILNGYRKGSMPDEYVGGVGKEGVENLKKFVEAGGTLVFLNRSSLFAIEHFDLPIKNVTAGLNRRDFYIPGSILRTELDTTHPIAKGMPAQSIAWFEQSPVFEIQRQETGDKRQESGKSDSPDSRLQSPVLAIKVIAKYPNDPKEVLLSGWALGQDKIAGKAALVEVTYGKGKIVLFGFRPQYRGQSLATFPLLFNAISQ